MTKRENEIMSLFYSTLELIATPKRPDGTYNRDREACEKLAKNALAFGNTSIEVVKNCTYEYCTYDDDVCQGYYCKCKCHGEVL